MSHQEYVDSCNLEQLYDLQTRIESRIRLIQNAQKDTLWAVSDEWINYKYFKEEHFNEAVQYMLKIIPENTKHPDDIQWEIKQVRASQETLHEYDILEPK